MKIISDTSIIISVPGISQRLAFYSVPENDVFYLFNRKNKDLVHLFLKNNVGGPAIIFDRFQEAGMTSINKLGHKNV